APLRLPPRDCRRRPGALDGPRASARSVRSGRAGRAGPAARRPWPSRARGDPPCARLSRRRARPADLRYFFFPPFPLVLLGLAPPPPASSSTLPDGSTAPFGPPDP